MATRILPIEHPLSQPQLDSERLVKLLGQPHLGDYIHFVHNRVIGGDAISARLLADEWRTANDHYHQLETQEAGIADKVRTKKIPAKLNAQIANIKADPFFRETYDSLPVEIKLVELERLVISQGSVGLGHSDQLRARLGTDPSDASLIDFCLPLNRNEAPVRVQKLSSDRYRFSSDSTDFRFHNAELLTAELARGIKSFGPICSGISLPVGYGSNFLTAVESEDRIVLQNGYHRAYSLLAAGVRFAPAIVQIVTRMDELRLAASSDVCDDPAFYFRAPRPPILKDFLNPLLGKQFETYRLETCVEIEFKVRTSTGVVAREV